jgi:EAL domain-containing protein (putative c-di-GMP-specific phosphodiesterase class I)/CHASE2 domain-containing sensor protein
MLARVGQFLMRGDRPQRVRRSIVAFSFAIILTVATLLEPIDQGIYSIQSRLAPRAPSGDIVFVLLDTEIVRGTQAESYRKIARLFDRLKAADPEMVMVDEVFEPVQSVAAMQALRASLLSFGERLWLVDRVVEDFPGREEVRSTTPDIAEGVQSTPNLRMVAWMGHTWEMPAILELEGRPPVLSAPAVLAGVAGGGEREFRIDYRYPSDAFVALDGSKVLTDSFALEQLRGKRIIVGPMADGLRDTASTPGKLEVPASFIIMIAAETLKGGRLVWLSPLIPLLLFFVASVATSCAQQRRTRHLSYAAQVVLFALLFSALPFVGWFASLSGAAIFGVTRVSQLLWQRSKSRAMLFDDRLGLPTFRGLENGNVAYGPGEHSLIVAKIHNFDDAMLAIPDNKHIEYIGKLVSRFQVIDPELRVFSSGYQYFAFILPLRGTDLVRDHLEGVRRLFFHPISIDGVEIDIGITFGVSDSPNISMREQLASARAAADQSNEADLPVVFAKLSTKDDRIWSLTLQNQIDRALQKGEIFPVFQPQFSVASGAIVGVEALVRWRDPERGMIPPSSFIEQCEQAGRIGALTEYMLKRSMKETKTVGGGLPLRLSVNISATTLQNDRLVEMVRESLDEARFDPKLLTLELTETWRILDQIVARSVMDEIKRLGIRWALDDFGIKTSTFETLLQYPFDELKIDRLFTNSIVDIKKGRAIVRSLCRVGSDAEIDVVAEGVETAAEYQTLSDLGCPIAQGFYLSKPLEIRDLRRLVADAGGVPRARNR